MAPVAVACKRILARTPTGHHPRQAAVAGAVIIRYYFDVTLVRTENRDDDDLEELRSRVAELEAMLGERDAEVARVKSELDTFRTTYRSKSARCTSSSTSLSLPLPRPSSASCRSRSGPRRWPERPAHSARGPSSAPRFTSDAVRKLFRDVAKTIHPDLARDEHTRDRRHALMIEANRAYALGDEEQLRWILQAWERSPEAVPGSDPEAMRLRLVRRIAQIEEQLEMPPAIWRPCRTRLSGS